MSKHKKLLEIFLKKPKYFSYEELKFLLSFLSYRECTSCKTSGSRVVFIDKKTNHLIKPHLKNILKTYQLDYLKDEYFI